MSLTERSRLGCIKSRQKRLQRKLEKIDQNSQPALDPDDALIPKQDLTTQKKLGKNICLLNLFMRRLEIWIIGDTCKNVFLSTKKR
jgi:hypothetical protein